MGSIYNPDCLDTLCGALAYAMGIEPPACAAPKNETLAAYVDKTLGGRKADRVFMYNPDAIAQWIYEKYPALFESAEKRAALRLPLRSVMPSVTPVCFGTMYTGALPEVHGIQKYEKPVIRLDSLFDALLRAGRKPVILGDRTCSLAHIFNERKMDYFFFETLDEVNAKAAELIVRDEHDFYVVYNGNYDAKMHKNGPESPVSLGELVANCRTYALFSELIRTHWKRHDTLVGFAMDHGCHEIDGDCGAHGLDMPEDLNIQHLYRCYPKE